MKAAKIRQIEECALNAWPASQQTLYDGWLLRFTDGYTKRANSVNPVYPGVLDIYGKIETCETVYRQMGLPSIFRLTPLAAPALDQALAAREYERIDPTRVMTQELADLANLAGLTDLPGKPAPAVELRELPLEQWMGVFSEISGSLVEKQPAHTAILRGIIHPMLTMALEIEGHWVACGLGVVERGWVGLFDIVTQPDYRRQGYGTQLVVGMLERAQELGARHSYLQVMENNAPALRLYAKLGYTDQYGYWYRRPAKPDALRK